MISYNTSNRILTIGCDYKTTKGGIATVLKNYSKIYYPFHFIYTSRCRGKISNLCDLVCSVFIFFIKCFSSTKQIIHIHSASNSSFKRKAIFINIAYLFRKKIILHIHGGAFKEFTESNSNLVTSCISKVDVIIALSENWFYYFKEKYPNKKIVKVPNIVASPRPILRNKNNNYVTEAVFLGLINKNKGIFDLLRIIHENRDYLTGKFKLHIGGNGETEKLCEYIKEYDMSNLVIYEGWVNEKEKEQLLSNSDVFILPSYIEGVPISILEAMSYKLPIISTTVGGIPEIVQHLKNGFLFSPGQHEKLFSYIKEIIENKETAKEMGAKSFELVKAHFAENVSQVLESIYKELLNK